ncbi:MAG: hypothetical protein SNF33_06120 [Candidatus Algichlamydia australiensis]|nr:hypothetical protein [Chlamydiales bacterium]
MAGKIQKKLQEQIKRFDVGPLLQLLYTLGYTQEEVLFESNPDLSSRDSVCEEISFQNEFPQVRILLNRGLLSNASALPSYFRKKMDEGELNSHLFSRFLSFFDHHLAEHSLSAKLLDQGGAYFDWEETQQHYLRFLVFNSISTICFLFQLCFPELVIKVFKSPKIIKLEGSSLILGKAFLGKSYLGENSYKILPSYEVMIFSDQSHTDCEIPWPKEARERLLEIIFPFLHGMNLYLIVKMIFEDCKNPIYLKEEPILGYGTVGVIEGPLITHLFSGEV